MPLFRWTDDEIRRQLADFCHERTRFPTQAEFHAAGRAGLERALHHRGASWWADQLSVPRTRAVRAAARSATRLPDQPQTDR
jgi:hypothetical protein